MKLSEEALFFLAQPVMTTAAVLLDEDPGEMASYLGTQHHHIESQLIRKVESRNHKSQESVATMIAA